jgi:hypothetical protein
MRLPTILAAVAVSMSAGLAVAQPLPPAAPAVGATGAAQSTLPPSPTVRAARKNMRLVCAPDLARACPDARPGKGGGLAQCMKQHHGEFAAACQDAITSLRQAKRAGA